MEEFHPIFNKLVNQIYDTALEPRLWPQLIDQLINTTRKYEQRKGVNKAALAHQQDMLLEHLLRSVEISEQLKISEDKSYFEKVLLQQLPFPILVLSSQGKVLQKNQHADKFINTSALITIKNATLCMDNKLLQSQFEQILIQLTKPNQIHAQHCIPLSNKNENIPISLNLSVISDQYQLKGNILVQIASNDPDQLPDIRIIAEHFSLTPTEAKLVNKLISNKTLQQIADDRQVSIHTVRYQLKSVLKKTGCHRQSELIKLIANSPLLPSNNIHLPLLAQRHLHAPCYHQQMTLQDGRLLGYADTGPRSGTPLFLMHPSTGSRLHHHPDETILFENKIRLITPDRPGFGLSDPNPTASILNYADDLCELADNLGLDKFSLTSYGGGAPYALACSVTLSQRVLQTILISPVSPFGDKSLFSTNKRLGKLAFHFPSAARPILKFMTRSLLIDPAGYYKQVYGHACESDVAGFSEPEVTDGILLAMREGMRQGPTALSNDLQLISQDWGIDFSHVTQPITIWHGTLDQHVPIEAVRQLHQALGNASLTEIKEHGHLVIYYCWREILNTIKKENTYKGDAC